MRKDSPLTQILLERNENLLKAGRPPKYPQCIYDEDELLGCNKTVENYLQ